MSKFTHRGERFVKADSARIYYEELGNKKGPALLLLHGGFGTMEDFNPIVSSLVEEFRIIGMDGRGQGKSTLGERKLTYQQMQLDAELLLDHLGINEVTVIGFSDGGMVGHLMALSNALKIKKLIVIGTPWTLNDLKNTSGLLSKVTADGWKEKFPESYNLYKKLNPEIDFETLTNALKEMWLDEGLTGGYPDERVKHISCQTLIIRGDEDHLVSRKSASLLADTIKSSVLLNVPFAGHEVHKDEATCVSSFIIRFLKHE